MKKIVSLMLAMIMAVSMLAACSKSEPAPAAEGGEEAATETAAAELTLNVASNATDETNPYSIGLEEFKKVAEEVSGGKIAVTVHKGTLGQNESELVEKLQMGAADMIVAAPAFMNAIGVPEVDFFSLEYLFDGFDHWEKCVDGDFGKVMSDIVTEKTGNQFKIMGYWSTSIRDVYAKKAITKPEDLKGLAIRTQNSQVQQEFFQACGAVPTSVDWGELYQALQQGVVDGAENDYTNITLKEHHKTDNGKYISETHHDTTTRLYLMDGNKYDQLTDEQKQWIEAACEAATAAEREATYRMFEESKQKAIADGAVVTEHADIDIDAFKAIATGIQDKFAEANNMKEQLEMVRNAAK